MRKPFDPALFAQNNSPAIETMLKYLGEGWAPNTNRYGPDIVGPDGSLVEVEIKRVWTGAEFQYPDVQIPERKGKWRELDIHFFILNLPLTHAIKFSGEEMLDERLAIVPNKYVRYGEKFFKIPLEYCEVIEL